MLKNDSSRTYNGGVDFCGWQVGYRLLYQTSVKLIAAKVISRLASQALPDSCSSVTSGYQNCHAECRMQNADGLSDAEVSHV